MNQHNIVSWLYQKKNPKPKPSFLKNQTSTQKCQWKKYNWIKIVNKDQVERDNKGKIKRKQIAKL